MALNILIVDDSTVTRKVIGKTLRIAGVPLGELYEAADGQQALDVLAGSWVDLVLSDINMPVMNGVELVERMSKDDVLRSIPIIVVSTEGSSVRIEQLKSKGVSAFVRKPFTPELIRELVFEITGVRDDG